MAAGWRGWRYVLPRRRSRDRVEVVPVEQPASAERRRPEPPLRDEPLECPFGDAQVVGGLVEREPRGRTIRRGRRKRLLDPLGDQLLNRLDELREQPVDRRKTSVQVLRQASRTLPSAASMIRDIAATTTKPQVDNQLALVSVDLKQVAAVESGVPNIVINQREADSIIEQDLRLALNEALDKLAVDAVAPSGFQAPSTDPLLVSVRKAMSQIYSAGYSPTTLVLRPADSEALDTLQTSGTEKDYVFGAGRFAPASCSASTSASQRVRPPRS